jgi:hypothetical protein
VELDDKDDGAVEIGAGLILADVLNDMIAKLNAAEEEGSDDENPVVSSTDEKEKEDDLFESDKADLLFADGNSRKACDELKLMIQPECTIEQIGEHALKTLVFLLQLGQIEKGSLTMDLKYKSLSAR